MASRHLSRSIVLQSLYEWDFYNKKPNLKDIVERNIKDFGPGLEEVDFIWQLINGITKHLVELDKIIEMLDKGEMPPKKMIEMHPEAKISAEDSKIIKDWAAAASENLMK